jgi:hypothetical protein
MGGGKMVGRWEDGGYLEEENRALGGVKEGGYT